MSFEKGHNQEFASNGFEAEKKLHEASAYANVVLSGEVVDEEISREEAVKLLRMISTDPDTISKEIDYYSQKWREYNTNR